MYTRPATFGSLARFRNHDTAVRVADENCRTVLGGQHVLGRCDIIPQRSGRILDDRDAVAALLENVVNALPGTVHAPP